MYNNLDLSTFAGGKPVSTEEEIGYQDAMRQVHRALQRRLKSLQEELHTAEGPDKEQLQIRIAEVEHLIQTVESLHR